MRKLIVWTVVHAPLEVLVDAMTDARALSDGVPAPLWWRAEDPDGLSAAWRTATAGRFAVSAGLGPVSRSWPTEVTEGLPGLRVTSRGALSGLGSWVHRRHVERAIGDRVRMVDEVVLVAPRVLADGLVGVAQRALVALHRGIVARVGGSGDDVGRHRVYRLSDANAEHAEDALAGGPDANG